MTSRLEIFTAIQKLLNEFVHYENERELLDDVYGDQAAPDWHPHTHTNSEKTIKAVREIIHTYWNKYGIRKELYCYLDSIYSNLIYAMNNIDGMAVDSCVLRNDDGAMCFAAYNEQIQLCIEYIEKLLCSTAAAAADAADAEHTIR
jgi:hypothetical protein